MGAFSKEEYEIMIFELTQKQPQSYDMMLSIAERYLTPLVIKRCRTDSRLNSRQLENDILQEVYIRLVKTCVTGFLKRKDKGYVVNRNPEEFCAWMTTVMKHAAEDIAEKEEKQSMKIPLRAEAPVPEGGDKTAEEQLDRICDAFDIVLGARNQPHILLTWLLQSLLMIRYGLNKIDATRMMEKMLADKTLFDMWAAVKELMDQTAWLTLTEEQEKRMQERLNKKDGQGVPVGQTYYRDRYMRKGARGSISDWANRVNTLIEESDKP